MIGMLLLLCQVQGGVDDFDDHASPSAPPQEYLAGLV